MSDFDDLLDEVAKLRRDLDDHKVRTANMVRVGPVSERDHKKGFRVDHGAEGEDDKSPWMRLAERSGVESDLPRKGEQIAVLAPYGDPLQGIGLPFGHTKENPNPAPDADTSVIFNRDGCTASVKDGKLTWKAKEMVYEVGKAKLTLKEGSAKLEVDGKSYNLDGDGHTLTGGKVSHDKKNIGATHVHGGVMAGAAKTRDPEA